MHSLHVYWLLAVVAITTIGNTVAADLEEYNSGTDTALVPSAMAAATETADEAAPITASDKIGVSDGVEFSSTPLFTNSFTIEPCNLNAPNKNDCIKQLFQQIVPRLKQDGLPQYGMPSIDPYFYRRGIFRYDNDGIQGGLLIKNMHIHGISGLQVNTFLSNFTAKGFIVKLSIEIPKINANGQFKADVKFGGLRLVPKGPFNITIDNIRATILTDGTFEKTDVGRRLQLNRLNASVGVGTVRIIANGIFSDRNLNAMILNLVNENLPEITRVGIPATRDQWAPVLVTHINEFFANVPIDTILLQ